MKDNNEIFQYHFDDTKGTFTPMKPKAVGSPEGTGPRNGFFHPNGKAVYFSNEQGLGVSTYKIQKDGTLTRLQVQENKIPVPAGAKASLSASFMVGTPDGKFVFIGNREKTDNALDRLVSFAVQDDLTLKHASTLAFPNKIPWGAEVTKCGKYIFITSANANTLHAYQIKSDGSLKELHSIDIPGRCTSIAVR